MSGRRHQGSAGVNLGDPPIEWIIPLLQWLTEQKDVIARSRQSGSALPPATAAAVGWWLADRPSRSRWGAAARRPPSEAQDLLANPRDST
jgi:hypothetical protein